MKFSNITKAKILLFNNKKTISICCIGLLIITAIIVNQRIIQYGIIFESNDIKYHIIWLQNFSQQISEGIYYPRWLSRDNYGYGSPTFVFYPPLVYYVGSLFKLSGLSIDNTIILLFYLATFLASLSFFCYGYKRWGIVAAVIGAVCYVTTPYIAFNIYSRGALGEIWAIAFIPCGLWLTHKTIDYPKSKWKFLLAIIAALLALTHVPSLLLFTIAWLFYLLILLARKPWKNVLLATINIFSGFGLASFYLLPAIFEKSLINIDFMRFDDGYKRNLISFNFFESTKTLHKFIEPIFLYNAAIILLLIAIVWFLNIRQKLILKDASHWLSFLVIIAFFSTIPSLFIWQSSSTLQMVQFPWRLFSLLAFGVAGLISFTVAQIINLKTSLTKNILLTAILVIITTNLAYSYKISLNLSGIKNPGNIAVAKARGSWKASIYEQINTALDSSKMELLKGPNEYRPLLANNQPAPAPKIGQPKVSVSRGEANFTIQKWDNYQRLVNVNATKESNIKFRIYYYPAWKLYIDDQLSEFKIAEDGTILTTIPQGSHQLELRYGWTTMLKLGTILSILSFLFILYNTNKSTS